MPIDERWEDLTPAQWDSFARAWIEKLRESHDEATKAPSEDEWDVGDSVVQMNFTAPSECQWLFILSALKYADSDDELSHLAAGPVEHLLGWHGVQYIEIVEREAEHNPKFAKMLTGVWKYTMNNEVWQRVQTLQARATSPLKRSGTKKKDV